MLDTWPAVRHADEAFLARPGPAYGGVPPGDHLQTTYNLWLVGHQLARGAFPLHDPYSFQPEAEPRANLQGWLLGVPFWPLRAIFGPVVGWNAIVLLGFVLAGGATVLWLRALGLPLGAAAAGGLAFALAPYRVAQSTGHLLGLIAFLLPLALFALERARASDGRPRRLWLALAVASLAAVPLSGQVHLALGAIPFVVGYAWVRGLRAGAAVAGAVGVAAGLFVGLVALAGSIASGGRSLGEVGRYSAEAGDLIARELEHGLERFVFLGWATPLVALAGLVVLARTGRRGLAWTLGLGAVVPIVLALGTNTPLYEPLWHVLPPLQYPRVPGRLLPVAWVALAALVAFAAARLSRPVAVGALLLLLALDLRVEVFRAVGADEDDGLYAALAAAPGGRLLELPVFGPQEHYGSRYQYYALQAPRERPGGYSTTAPRSAARVAAALRPLGCGAWTPARAALVQELGVRYVAVHRGLYAATAYVGEVCAPKAVGALEANGFRRLAGGGEITIFGRGR